MTEQAKQPFGNRGFSVRPPRAGRSLPSLAAFETSPIIMDANFAALITAFGQPMQALVLFVAAAVFAAWIVNLVLKASICLLNRVQRYCRHSLLTNSIVDNFCSSRDREVVKLRANVEAMQQHEMELVDRYARSGCAAEDVIRAKSLRLLAEIQLLQYDKMPKSWAEKCAAQAAFRKDTSH